MPASASAALSAAFFVLAAGLGLAKLAPPAFRPQRPANDDLPQGAGRIDLAGFEASELAAGVAAVQGPTARIAKRALDVAAALALLIVTSPLLFATAAAIKLDSKGPVLYRQRRIGLGGAAFEIFKFRSMRTDAEVGGARWAALKDARVTRVGRLIRRTRVDEIPQAINILRGEMSFVGPRPERPEFAGLLANEIPHYQHRHVIRPGITGWAQVKYVYTASVEGARTKLAYDLYYIKHYSPVLDLWIILKTVRVALFGIGSR